jgi:AcrR family transcriptional regulator
VQREGNEIMPARRIVMGAQRPPTCAKKSESFVSAAEPGLGSNLPKVDGRRIRSERNRQMIIDAYLRLLRRNPTMPTASQIAEEAYCSVRSVFQHFSNLKTLTLATADHAIAVGQAEAVARNVDADRATRIRSHVETRALACEKWLPLWKVLVRQEQAELRQRVSLVRAENIERIKLMYRPELATLQEPDRDQLLLALTAFTSFESWDQLRHSYGLSVEAAQAVWRSAIDRLLPRDDLLLATSG